MWGKMILAWVILAAARLLCWTLRVRIEGPAPDSRRPLVYAFLHGMQLPLLRYPRPKPMAVLTSRSGDGELQSRIMGSLRFSVVRGSSSRGGAKGLVSLVRKARDGCDIALAVDGPKGPYGHVKPGALFVAQKAGAMVVPIVAAASFCIRLRRSWDRFLLPMPWARVVLLRGEAFEVAPGGGDQGLEQARAHLQEELERLSAAANETPDIH